MELRPTGARLRVNCHVVTSDAAEGTSIAVNGVCLDGARYRCPCVQCRSRAGDVADARISAIFNPARS